MKPLALAVALTLGLAGPALSQAVNDQTTVPGRAAMTPTEQAVLARLNVWMDKYDHDPKAMCEEVYTPDTQVWVPNAGLWYRHRDTWSKYEVANHARRTTPRNTKFVTAFVRGSVAVVEANGWVATLYFEPGSLRVFTDRTYIPSLALTGAPAADAPLVSAGSLPPAEPDRTSLRYGAIEERDGMILGHQRTRAQGLKIIGEGGLTAEETRNVAAIRRRADLYNQDPARVVDVYADGFTRTLVRQGRPAMKNRASFAALQKATRQAFPDTRVQVVTIVPRGDMVAYEQVTSFKPGHEEWSLTVARLKDGKIAEERVYDSTTFDPASPVGQAFKAATS